MKKINWKVLLIVIGILLLGTGILLYKLGDQYIWSDEVFSFHAARMILEKGIPLYDSGLYYGRSEIYNYLLAWSMQIFGISEFGSRIINIPFILATSLLIFFFARNTFSKYKKKEFLALIPTLLFLTANFTIAAVRETRMYSMTIFLFVLSAIAFYYGFISEKTTKTLKIKKLEFRYNIIWILTFLIAFGIGYETQPISIILGVGILVFYIARFCIRRKKEDLIFIIAMILIAFGSIYSIYGTLNIYSVFLSLSPEWATETPKFLYYLILLARNFPAIALLSPIIIYSLFKYRRALDWYIFSIFATYVIFISLQQAQHERYLQPVLPLLPILLIISLSRVIMQIRKYRVAIISFIALILLVPQVYLLQKELREIDTYTPTSLAIYKKMEFNTLFKYLDSQDIDNTVIIADFHSAMTLYEKGYYVDYILVAKKQDRNDDLYFNIPYLVYGDDFENVLQESPDHLLILRDWGNYPGLEEYVTQITDLQGPRVYR